MGKLQRNENVEQIIDDYLKMCSECLVLKLEFFSLLANVFLLLFCLTDLQSPEGPNYPLMLAEAGAMEALTAVVSKPGTQEIHVCLFRLTWFNRNDVCLLFLYFRV